MFLIIYILTIPLFIIMSITLSLFGERLYRELDKNNKNSVLRVVNGFKFFKNQTSIYANMISENFLIQRGVHHNETGMILRQIQPLAKDLNVNYIIIHNINGVIIAQSHTPELFNIDDKNNIAFKKALNNYSTFLIREHDKTVILTTTVPIYHESNKNIIVGATTVGYKIDNIFANRMKKLSDANLIFYQDTKIVASSFAKNKDKVDSKYTIREVNIETLGDFSLKIEILIDNLSIQNSLFWLITLTAVTFFIFIITGLFFAFKITKDITKSTNIILNSTVYKYYFKLN